MKFVNDVFLNDKKVCGVLSKLESQGDSFKLMIGIGVNLNTLHEHYPDLKSATSVLIETGKRIQLSLFAESLTKKILTIYSTLEKEGFSRSIYEFIKNRMYLLNEEVKIYDKNLKDVTL